MLKIMVVDGDVPQIREISDELGLQYRLLNCNKGDKALELLTVFQPDALILDPATPGLDAEKFIAGIRGLAGPRVPILLLSHFPTLRSMEKSLDWGADFIFSKPCPGERLARKLAECLEKARRFSDTQLVEL